MCPCGFEACEQRQHKVVLPLIHYFYKFMSDRDTKDVFEKEIEKIKKIRKTR